MSLKEITKDLHDQAEQTKFMRAIFDGNINLEAWIDFTYQKTLFYGTIEGAAGSCGLLKDLPDIQRAFYLYKDYCHRNINGKKHSYRTVSIDYHNYLLSIAKNADAIMAHLYVWHMGDLYGGQMIKKIVPGSHRALEFNNSELLIKNLRSKLNHETMGQEARVAFNWAIRILKEYDDTACGS